jgi:hypothetical protein
MSMPNPDFGHQKRTRSEEIIDFFKIASRSLFDVDGEIKYTIRQRVIISDICGERFSGMRHFNINTVYKLSICHEPYICSVPVII